MRFFLAVTLLLSLAGPAGADPAFDPQEMRERLEQCPAAVRALEEIRTFNVSWTSQMAPLSGVPRLRALCDGMKVLEHGFQRLYGAVRTCQGQHAVGLEPIAQAVSDLRVKTGMKRSQTCD